MFKKEIINDALNNNKHVFVEKPLSKSHADIDSFYQLAKDRNKVLSVGYNLIYFPSIKKILEIVSEAVLVNLKVLDFFMVMVEHQVLKIKIIGVFPIAHGVVLR